MTKRPSQYSNTAWRSVQSFFARLGIHPLAALAGIFLLLVLPRLFLLAAVIYVLFWLYRNRGLPGTQQNVFSRKGGRGKGRGKGRR